MTKAGTHTFPHPIYEDRCQIALPKLPPQDLVPELSMYSPTEDLLIYNEQLIQAARSLRIAVLCVPPRAMDPVFRLIHPGNTGHVTFPVTED